MKKKYSLAIVFLIAVIFLIINNRQSKPQRKNFDCQDCNVVFILLDTLRADRISSLGYARKTTPNIDVLADKSLVFTNAISVAPWTLPSNMSIFTSLYPSQHQMKNKFLLEEGKEERVRSLADLSPEVITLAQVLSDKGFKTAGFTGGAGVKGEFGFNLGFDIYIDEKDFIGLDENVPQALDWIEENKNSPFFLFLHGYDIHGQFVPEGGYDERFVDFDYKGDLNGSKDEQQNLREEGLKRGELFLAESDVKYLRALYDEKVARADAHVGKFIEGLREMNLNGKTVIIVTSDHGEELYEHGRIDHGFSLYEEQVRVPLIISIPGNNEQISSDNQVNTLDVMPTIIALLKLNVDDKVKKQMEGVNLFDVLHGRAEEAVYPETDYRYHTYLRSVRTGKGLKLIRNIETNDEEVYDLNSDSKENVNLNEKAGNWGDKLQELLDSHLERVGISYL